MSTIRLGGVEFRPEEVDAMREIGECFILHGRRLFRIAETGKGAKSVLVHSFSEPQTRRGRFYSLTLRQVQDVYPELELS